MTALMLMSEQACPTMDTGLHYNHACGEVVAIRLYPPLPAQRVALLSVPRPGGQRTAIVTVPLGRVMDLPSAHFRAGVDLDEHLEDSLVTRCLWWYVIGAPATPDFVYELTRQVLDGYAISCDDPEAVEAERQGLLVHGSVLTYAIHDALRSWQRHAPVVSGSNPYHPDAADLRESLLVLPSLEWDDTTGPVWTAAESEPNAGLRSVLGPRAR